MPPFRQKGALKPIFRIESEEFALIFGESIRIQSFFSMKTVYIRYCCNKIMISIGCFISVIFYFSY